ncbi:hypothetical protein UFOVP1419_20 [uncultured Caudovirales phage]|uniref:Uncharacterized protein n=1 Tax=uncultured Caudovirales phage TaxID=2100421 RepID=A0A6J5SD57_9CAUD|nr:hypothetical protein UFOVP1419_20 [uncultured Caudovirales phage]
MTREDREEIARIFRVELQAALRMIGSPSADMKVPPAVVDMQRAKLEALARRDKSRQKKALQGIYYD